MTWTSAAAAPHPRLVRAWARRVKSPMEEVRGFVGLDAHKTTVSGAAADTGRRDEVAHIGTTENTAVAIAKLARELPRRHDAVEFAYEAGSCGYVVQGQLTAWDSLIVSARQLTPRKPGERFKNDPPPSAAAEPPRPPLAENHPHQPSSAVRTAPISLRSSESPLGHG
jgi:hypothetical protein